MIDEIKGAAKEVKQAARKSNNLIIKSVRGRGFAVYEDKKVKKGLFSREKEEPIYVIKPDLFNLGSKTVRLLDADDTVLGKVTIDKRVGNGPKTFKFSAGRGDNGSLTEQFGLSSSLVLNYNGWKVERNSLSSRTVIQTGNGKEIAEIRDGSSREEVHLKVASPRFDVVVLLILISIKSSMFFK